MPEGTTDEEGLLLARQLQTGRRNLTAEEWKACREAIRAYYLGLRWGGMNQAEAAEKTNIPCSTGNG